MSCIEYTAEIKRSDYNVKLNTYHDQQDDTHVS